MKVEPASPPSPHDDGLEWLREIRRRLLSEANGDLKQLGDCYRQTQARHPDKVFDPQLVLADAARSHGFCIDDNKEQAMVRHESDEL